MATTTLLTVTALLILILLGHWLRRPTGASSSAPQSPAESQGRELSPQDALRFRERLNEACDQHHASLGLRRLAVLDTEDLQQPWPLEPDERRTGSSERIWFIDGPCVLPRPMNFDAEVVSSGPLSTQPGQHHYALMSDQTLELAPLTRLSGWAHAQRIEVGEGVEAKGPLSAATSIHLAPGVRFHSVNAPTVRAVERLDRAGTRQVGEFQPLTEEEGVYWDPQSRRGHTLAPLQVTPLRQWVGDLISRSDVRLGEGCGVRGHIRCHGDLTLQAGCCIEGSLSAYGEIFLAPGCQISGDIQTDSLLTIGPGCVIGSPEHPVTVRAAQLEMAKGVVLHGRVSLSRHWVDWARAQGRRPDPVDAVAAPSALTRQVLGLSPAGTDLDQGMASPGWTLGLPASTWQATSAAQVFQTRESQARIASNHTWEGQLICPGDLHVAEGCRAIGSLRATGHVLLEAGTLLLGDVECGQELRISGGTQLGGSLRAGQAIHLGPGCVIGSVGRPVVVEAPVVTLGLGTVIHGQVRAHGLDGRTLTTVGSGSDLIRNAVTGPDLDLESSVAEVLAA